MPTTWRSPFWKFKARHLVPIAMGFACVIGAYFFICTIEGEIKHTYVHGEQLSVATLRPNEEIIVTTLYSHRRAIGREYRLRNDGLTHNVIISDTTPDWSRDSAESLMPLPFARDLSETEVKGLDETLKFYRATPDQHSSAINEIHVRYLRNQKQIGEEFHIGFYLTSQIAFYARQGMRGVPDYDTDYAKLAHANGLTVEQLNRMIPFEMLEREEPNQALTASR